LNLDVFNACLFAEGDSLILEKKIVLDTATGKTPRLPWDILRSAFRHPIARLAAVRYLFYLVKIALIGSKARDEDQLLRDLAWSRAHLFVLNSWMKRDPSYQSSDWYQSYSDVLLRWPTPTIF